MAKVSTPPVVSFEQAIAETREGQSKVHVLLGNGFSIDCRPDFRYARLLDEADFSELSIDAARLFELFDTANFEQIIQTLQAAARLIRLYRTTKPKLADELELDAARLKEALAEVLARTHPERPSSLEDEEYAHAAAFLAHFDAIYTVNYDLLLYWTVMWTMGRDATGGKVRDDGFRDPGDDTAEYVTWQAFADDHRQTIHYLHGALHLFDAGSELHKATWVRSGTRLVVQIRQALAAEEYPLVVTEGTSTDKLTKITHNGYLSRSFRSLGALPQRTALFVHGLSLADNDQHILDVIVRSKLGHLYVGLHGDVRTSANQAVISRALALADRRVAGRPLVVSFYDSASAKVWQG